MTMTTATTMTMAPSISPSTFIAHTSHLCLAFGATFALVNPRLDALLSANLTTAEARLVARHFGLALLLVGHVCRIVASAEAENEKDGGGSVDVTFPVRTLIAWHFVVVATFLWEYSWIGAFKRAPFVTRVLAYGGALAHFLVLVEGTIVCLDRRDRDAASGGALETILRAFEVASTTTMTGGDDSKSPLGASAAMWTALCSAAALAYLIVQRGRASRRRCTEEERWLSGELVVITGAAGGIGRELSLAFARAGARVVLWDVREEALRETARWLASRGVDLAKVTTAVVDVSDPAAVKRAAEALREAEGRGEGRGGGRAPRVVVSNAAVMRGKMLFESTDEELRRDFGVNCLGSFWVHRAFLSWLLDDDDQQGDKGVGKVPTKKPREKMEEEEAADAKREHARTRHTLVTMGSVMASIPAARQTEYCASKAALSQFHECLRWELRKIDAERKARGRRGANVRSLLVQPYAVNTEMIAGAALLGELGGKGGSAEGEGGATVGARRKFALLKRIFPPLEPEDVARRVVEAVRSGDERAYVPRAVGWIVRSLDLMPGGLADVVLGFGGALDGTDGFRGCALECDLPCCPEVDVADDTCWRD